MIALLELLGLVPSRQSKAELKRFLEYIAAHERMRQTDLDALCQILRDAQVLEV